MLLWHLSFVINMTTAWDWEWRTPYIKAVVWTKTKYWVNTHEPAPFVSWKLGTSKMLVDFRVFKNDARPVCDSLSVPIEFRMGFILVALHQEDSLFWIPLTNPRGGVDFVCGKVNFLPYQNLSPDAEGGASVDPCNLASGLMTETDLLSFLPCSFLERPYVCCPPPCFLCRTGPLYLKT